MTSPGPDLSTIALGFLLVMVLGYFRVCKVLGFELRAYTLSHFTTPFL
jgi:hypothetical protein